MNDHAAEPARLVPVPSRLPDRFASAPVPVPVPERRPGGPVPAIRLSDQRIGDAERSAVCEQLSDHYAAGRLTEDELEVRVDAAMRARTRGDLHPLLADLPGAPVAVPPSPDPIAVRIGQPWSTLDILSLIALIGSVSLALLGAMAILAGGEPGYVVIATMVALTAGVGGMALTQVLHRWHRSVIDRATRQIAEQRRPPGPTP